MAELSHKHHYVPEWYQKRFLIPGRTAFKILDLRPTIYRDHTGKVRNTSPEILVRGPKAHFYESELYTTRFDGVENDDIETFLFGGIDRKGRRALDDLLKEDFTAMHESYPWVFEFMDALRLRTPKGLSMVQAITNAKVYDDLLIWMQELRHMHSVMWGEAVREIFKIEDSSVGLIFSDHPVTLFNRYVFPVDPKIPPRHDPHLHWLGTQTLFPLDREHLMVITHKEWGRKSGPQKARQPRTNARFWDPEAMMWYHDIERKRTLSPKQVREVNYIIKQKAWRYIAALDEEELYPEKYLKTRMWSRLGQFLMPSGFSTAKQTGYTVIGFNDGSYHFQDEHGRRPKNKAEYEAAVEQAKKDEAIIKEVLAKHRDKSI